MYDVLSAPDCTAYIGALLGRQIGKRRRGDEIGKLRECDVLDVMRGIYPDATALELRQQLDYLADRKMVELNKQPSGMWFADLTSLGVDIAEYTVECYPGIARPEKYWEG